MKQVKILGAGLSGLSTALLLARRGIDVEVRERRRLGGGRFAGGFQVLENGSTRTDAVEELAGLGLRPACELAPLRSAVLIDAKRRRWEVASAEPYAYLIRRGSGEGTLDHWLIAEARVAGVRISAGGADERWRPDVVATGPKRADGVAREVVFETRHRDIMAVLFDPEITPTGYSYLFVRDGRGTMGAAQVRGVRSLRSNARRAFAELRSELPMEMRVLGEHVQYMNFAIPRHLHAGGRWFVGEAAGVQEFLFGLGNRLAVRSAALTARAVAGEGWDDEGFRSGIVSPMIVSVLGRAAYEWSGPGGLGRLCRRLARGDFRDRLIDLQRPSPTRALAARMVMALWRDRSGHERIQVGRWSRKGER